MQPLLERVDLAVEVFSFFTAILIALGSLYAYSKTHKTRHAAFGVAFLSIATSLAASAILNAFVNFEELAVPLRGYLLLTYTQSLFHIISMLGMLGGLIVLLLTNEEVTNVRLAFPLLLLAPLGAWVGHEFYIAFHALALILIILCVFHYARWHREAHSSHSLLVAVAFSVFAVSEATFILTIFSPVFYLLGHSILFIAFAILFVTLVSIYRSTMVAPRATPRRR